MKQDVCGLSTNIRSHSTDIVATAPWRPVFVHPCATTPGLGPSIPLQSSWTVGSDDHVTNDCTSKRFGLANIVRREM